MLGSHGPFVSVAPLGSAAPLVSVVAPLVSVVAPLVSVVAPLVSVVTLVGLAVALGFAAGLFAVGYLLIRGLVSTAGHDDPDRRRRGWYGYHAGLAAFGVGFVGLLATFAVDDAVTAATGLGYGVLLNAGIGLAVVGGLAMAVGIVVAMDGGG